MREVDLLVTLAEIAGVFIGFGALISVRSDGASDVEVVVYIRSVLMAGVWVVVAGLAPATLGAYGLAGHDLWLVCSLLGLAGVAAMYATSARTAELRALMRGESRARWVREGVGNTVVMVPMFGSLILVVLGLFPDQEPALYLTAVVMGLFLAALTLLYLVYSRPRSATASDEAGLQAE